MDITLSLSSKGGKEIDNFYDSYPEVHLHLHSANSDYDRIEAKIHRIIQRLKVLETNPSTDQLEERINILEDKMAETNDRVLALTAAVTEYNEDVTAKLNSLRTDIEALRAEVEAGRPAAEELSRVNQSLFDLENAVGSGVSTVGDADADGVPAAPAPPVE